MKKLSLPFITLLFLAYPTPAFAHAFGKLYNLPIPFWLYLYGGAAALLVSFVVIGYFVNATRKHLSYPAIPLANTPISFLWKNSFINMVKVISVFIFLLTIATGLFGQNDSYLNFNMTFFWIIILLGLTYFTAIAGNIYEVLNPWKNITEWIEKLLKTEKKGLLPYPKKLGYYPALFFYFLLIWFELLGRITPIKLSFLLLEFSVLTAVGILLIGKVNWFTYGDFFSVFFKVIGKVSIIEERKGKLFLRPPFVGLLKEKAEHISLLLFILFMLSSTAFDGFKETLPWIRLYSSHVDPLIRPFFGINSYIIFQTVGLLLSPLLFLSIYILLLTLTKIITKSALPLRELLLKFAFSLVPIAVVYNAAHYYTLLFTQGSEILRMFSDPFGFGWNLFGTVDYNGSVILDANFVWHSQVALILLGHIVAVYLAHLAALQLFPTQKKALISQFPMLLLMVVYTMIGLWILSQPITTG